MKSLVALIMLIATSTANANFRSTEIVTCVNAIGTEKLTIQLLSDVTTNGTPVIGTFIDYKKNGETVYSSSSFDKPIFIPAGAGAYVAHGNGTEAGKTLSFGLDYTAYKASLPGVFDFDQCTQVASIGKVL